MLAAPGASGSISFQIATMIGDCQSPGCAALVAI